MLDIGTASVLDNPLNGKKLLAKLQASVSIASVKSKTLTEQDLSRVLQECFTSDSNASTKALGYQFAFHAAHLITQKMWKILKESIVSDLTIKDDSNLNLLLQCIQMLEIAPIQILLELLSSQQINAMSKFRELIHHENHEVCSLAITVLSKMSLKVAKALSTDEIWAMPFESHQQRILCQQDIQILLTDLWKDLFAIAIEPSHKKNNQNHGAKVNLEGAFLAGDYNTSGSKVGCILFNYTSQTKILPVELSCAAFKALNLLMSTELDDPEASSSYSVEALRSTILKAAIPSYNRVLFSIRQLPVVAQLPSISFLGLVLRHILNRCGANCASVSVPIITIDRYVSQASEDHVWISTNLHNDEKNFDCEDQSLETVRIDEIVHNFLFEDIVPLLKRIISGLQRSDLIRITYMLLSHTLMKFCRQYWAFNLHHDAVAQFYYLKSCGQHAEPATCIVFLRIAVNIFSWLSSSQSFECFSSLVNAVTTISDYMMRQEIFQQLWQLILQHDLEAKDFQVLEFAVNHASKLCGYHTESNSKYGTSPLRLAKEISNTRHNREIVYTLFRVFILKYSNYLQAFNFDFYFAQSIALNALHGILLTDEFNELCDLYFLLLAKYYQSNRLASNSGDICYALPSLQEISVLINHITNPNIRLRLLWTSLHHRVDIQKYLPAYKVIEVLREEVEDIILNKQIFHTPSKTKKFLTNKLQNHGSLFCIPENPHTNCSIAPVPVWEQDDSISQVELILKCLNECIRKDRGKQDMCNTLQSQLVQVVATNKPSYTFHTLYNRVLLNEKSTVSGVQADFSVPYKLQTSTIGCLTPVALSPMKKAVDYNSKKYTNKIEYGKTQADIKITANSDPLALYISHCHPNPEEPDIITLTVRCVNVTDLELSGFEISILTKGALRPVTSSMLKSSFRRCSIYPCSSETPNESLQPYGVVKFQRRFKLQRFTTASFIFQVQFRSIAKAEVSLEDHPAKDNFLGETEGTSQSHELGITDAIKEQKYPFSDCNLFTLAASDAYILPYIAFFRSPPNQVTDASNFRLLWSRSLEKSTSFPIRYCSKTHEANMPVGQHLLRNCNTPMHVVAELTADLPASCHIALISQTHWMEYLCVSITLHRNTMRENAETNDNFNNIANNWSGICEVRSCSFILKEIRTNQQLFLDVVGGEDLRGILSEKIIAFDASKVIPPLASHYLRKQ